MSYTAMPPAAPAPQPGPPPPVPLKTSNGLATAGFVLGLLGFLGAFIPVINIGGLILGVVGAILAAVGLAKSKKTGSGKGLAMAGLILGLLAVIIAIVINIAFANAVDDAVEEATGSTVEVPADPTDDGTADDEAAPVDEAVEDALGTTRANPAPIGSAIAAGDWTITINSVTTVNEDAIGQSAAAGMALLMVNMTATYEGDDEQGATPWANVGFVTAEGATIGTIDGSTLFIPEDQFSSLTTVYNGASVSGNQIFEVPADGWENGVLAVTPDLFADDSFVAVK